MSNKFFVKTNEIKPGKGQFAMETPDFMLPPEHYGRADHAKDPQVPLKECFKQTLANTRKGLKW